MRCAWLDWNAVDRDAVCARCRALKGVTEGFPFDATALVFKVGGKMFAILVEDSVSLKCDPGYAVALREQYPAVTAGYHLNKRHWNTTSSMAPSPVRWSTNGSRTHTTWW